MAKNTDQVMELQAMLHDGQQISESTIVPIEQVDEDNSCCLR